MCFGKIAGQIEFGINSLTGLWQVFAFLIGLCFFLVNNRGRLRYKRGFWYTGMGSNGWISAIIGINDLNLVCVGSSVGKLSNGIIVVGAIGEIGGIGTASTTTRAGAGSIVLVDLKGLEGLLVLKSIGT